MLSPLSFFDAMIVLYGIVLVMVFIFLMTDH